MITLTWEGGKGNVEQQKPEANELLENMGAKLRAVFPSVVPYAEEKRAEVLAYAAG